MKKKLRNLILKKRNSLSKKNISLKSAQIIKKLISLPEYKRAESIMLYASIGSEVSTLKFIRELLKNKEKTVVLPKVKGEHILLSKINSFNDLKRGAFNILEPAKIKKIQKVDLILVPGVAFDGYGHRIGYGKGYYDRLLEKTKVLKVGLAFEMQLIDKVPNHPHDISVDIVVTEKKVRRMK